ncbi:MAG: murein biosynthesis integral membrane protein MurJ [Pseudomonadota bacterium]
MKLYRAIATVGSFTLISRVLGFARDILIAAGLGSGPIADAFFVAFRFPNLFRRWFGEGAFNAAFVPLYAKRLEGEGEASASGFAGEASAGLTFILLLLSGAAIFAMPWLMAGLAPGFVGNESQYDFAVLLTQITVPYLICMSLVALMSGVLNSHGRYAAAAAAPILLNVILIGAVAGVMLFGGGGGDGTADATVALRGEINVAFALAIGVAFAGLAQLLMLVIALRRSGIAVPSRVPVWNADMKRLVTLGVPGLIAGGITQINIVVGTIIASLQAGAISYLYYADRLYQLPLGIVGIAIGVVLLPDIARLLRAGDTAGALDTQNRALEFALMLTIPAAIGLALAADPILSVLFERGAFDAEAREKTALALQAFAVGLPAFVLIKVFQPAFFAREDTATPMRYAGYNLVTNVVLSLALFFGIHQATGPDAGLGYVGIAIATSVAGWVNAWLLWRRLGQDGAYRADAGLRRAIPIIFAAAVVMGLALVAGLIGLAPWLAPEAGLAVRAAALALAIGGPGLVYFAILHLARVFRVSDLRRARSAEPDGGDRPSGLV